MPMKPMIKVEDLSKQYRIGTRGDASYRTLRDALAGAVADPFRRGRRKKREAGQDLWALDGVSFEVTPGEVLGVIGHNGAGKSTLLKILTRITEPTRGRVELYGRVGSLLEVGTGFHPELSGRENVYLNGAILGMKKVEIERKFDEIVAFAEIEKFLETPVKRYSSGMYTRLAFSVAAHLDPEILLVDEVLAVGDAAFQKKCLAKMGSASREGRTVLFVSHNFEAVKSLCTRCLLLDGGHIIEDGPPEVAIEKAFAKLRAKSGSSFKLHTLRDAPGVPRPASVEVRAADKPPGELVTFEDEVVATLELDAPLMEGHTFAFQVMTTAGTTIFNSFYRDSRENPPLRPGETRRVSARIPARLLPGGVYEAVFAYMLPNAELFWLCRENWFEIRDVKSYRNEGLTVRRTGLISLILPWDAE
ncbi:MAG TPA: polysaccharide ABC transporter ATP-binding protein [Pyrinomonadaceae bacterium]|nr:polysaccharide ABC transporter ATP-binding protein [Pyrinomonadaceae bacterium]